MVERRNLGFMKKIYYRSNLSVLNTTSHFSFSVTDEDDGEYIRCIVDPVYGDTIELERPTTHSRKSDSKISSKNHC